MEQYQAQNQKLRVIAAVISISVHIFLLVLKLIIGFLTNSLSIVALAIDSGFDLIAAGATFWGIRKISQPADEDHLYGYGKYDFLVSSIQGFLLLITALVIIIEGIVRLIFGADVGVHLLSFMILILGIIFNIILYVFLMWVSKKTRSLALEANAKNSIADILTNALVFVSLFFILILHLNFIDGIVAIALSIFIIYEGFDLIKKSTFGMLDKTPKKIDVARIQEVCESVPGVIQARNIRMRSSGPFIFMDLCAGVDSLQSVEFSHRITESLESKIKEEYMDITDVHVHVEPVIMIDGDNFKRRVRAIAMGFKEVSSCYHIHVGFAEDRPLVDLHVVFNSKFSLDYVHQISTQIEFKVKEELKSTLDLEDLDVLIHAEPYRDLNEDSLMQEIREIVDNLSVVHDCHNVRIRIDEKEILVNLHVTLDSEMSLRQAHQISTMIEKIVEVKIKEDYPDKAFDVNVHLEPMDF